MRFALQREAPLRMSAIPAGYSLRTSECCPVSANFVTADAFSSKLEQVRTATPSRAVDTATATDPPKVNGILRKHGYAVWHSACLYCSVRRHSTELECRF